MVLHFDTESADVNVIWCQNEYSAFDFFEILQEKSIS